MGGMSDDARRFAPATERNRTAILEVLRRVLPPSGLVLEVASGTGEHCAFFAAALPALDWQPSDPDAESRASVDAWCGRLPNVRAALALDAAGDWPVARAEAVLCVNMVHIAPWEATVGLMRGAGRVLGAGAPLVLYGPYRRDGVATAESNEDFDRSLRARDARWGLRRLEEVAAEAARNGFGAPEVVEMPANNVTVVFRKGSA
jgi:hypothetical protein